MPRSRLVRPDTVRIDISDGDWIVVKRRLNTGEQRKVFEGSRGPDEPDGGVTMDRVKAGLAQVRGYLLDWSLGEAEPSLAIRHKSDADIHAAIDAIEHETFVEILRAIEKHEETQTAERTAEKNARAGGTSDVAISPSPSEPDGASTGFVN